MTTCIVKEERFSQHHTSEGAGGAGVTVLASLFSSPIFQRSGGGFPRRKPGCPRHARQGFQEEELGESCRFSGGNGPTLELPMWPRSTPAPSSSSCHPSLFFKQVNSKGNQP